MADRAEQVSTTGLVDTRQQPNVAKRRQYSEALKRQMGVPADAFDGFTSGPAPRLLILISRDIVLRKPIDGNLAHRCLLLVANPKRKIYILCRVRRSASRQKPHNCPFWKAGPRFRQVVAGAVK